MENLQANSVIAPMIAQAQLRTYPKGQTILYPDDPTSHLFLIKKGAVTMHDVDGRQHHKTLHIFGPPALFPMVSFASDTASASWFYTTLMKTEVYLLPYLELKQRLEEPDSAATYNLLLKQLLNEVHELIVRISSSTKTNSLGRLVAALKFLAAHHSQPRPGGWVCITFSVSHQLLADMTGLARETVTLSMKQLQQCDCVRYVSVARLEVQPKRLNDAG